MFVCDWCGEPIPAKRGLVTIHIHGIHADTEGLDGLIDDRRRHFHAGHEDDETSCMLQALRLLDSRPSARALETIPTATEARISRLRSKLNPTNDEA